MRTFTNLLLSLVISSSLVACGADSSLDEMETRGSGVTASSFEAAWSSLYVRGTMNQWGTTPMHLVDDHQWMVEVTTGSSQNEGFKFDVYGDWRTNFGDDDGDQTADPGGRNIPLPPNADLVIHFNDATKFFWVEPRTWEAEVTFELPVGLAADVLRDQRADLSLDGEPWGWHHIYVEEGKAYAPICCLSKGVEAVLSFDSVLDGKRWVGEVRWTVDGTQNPIPVQMNLQEASLDDFGGVQLSVLSDRWENGQMVSGPYSNVGIYLGAWQAGHSLGHTGSDGTVSFMLPGGTQEISAMLMTSSHSMASASMPLEVKVGSVVDATMHIAPISVYIHAHYNTGMGKALYITGASDYLGDWNTASRMDWNGQAWTFYRNLPLGLPFKIVMADWSDDPTIGTDGVKWEKGPNRVVTPPIGYVSSEIAVYPSF